MAFLDQVERRLDLPAATKQQVLRELASHFAETKSELIESGMEASQAEIEAEKRLGEPADVAARLNATHNSASWKSALLCAVPFVLPAVSYLIPRGLFRVAVGYAIAVFISAVAVRELIKGRRPVWLATWFAGACYLGIGVGESVLAYWITNTQFAILPAHFIRSVFAIPALIVAWKSPRVRTVALALSALLIAAAFHRPANQIEGYAVMICEALPWVLLGIAVFDWHPHGSPNAASFFVTAWFLRKWLATTRYHDPYYIIAVIVLCALAAVWIARTSRREDKGFAVFATLIGLSVAWMADAIFAPPGYTASSVILPTLRLALTYFVIAMSPIWLDVARSRRDRPSVAR